MEADFKVPFVSEEPEKPNKPEPKAEPAEEEEKGPINIHVKNTGTVRLDNTSR